MSLHTSFLRVIMHHDLFKPATTPASTEVNRTTDYTVASVDSHASYRRRQPERKPVSQPEDSWFIIEMDQPQSFGDFAHGTNTGYDGRTPS